LPILGFKKFRSDWVTLGGVTPSRPVIRTMTVIGTNLILGWCAVAGQTYRAQYCTDLTIQAWTDLDGDVTATDAIATKAVPITANPQRFYRVTIVP